MTENSPINTPLSLALARTHHNPDGARRSHNAILDELRGDPRTHAILLRGTQLLAHSGELLYVPLIRVTQLAADAPLLYLGRTLTPLAGETEQQLPPDTPVIAVDLGSASSSRPTGRSDDTIGGPLSLGPGAEWMSLRELAHTLSSRDTGIAAQALAVTQWTTTTTHSPRTGERVHSVRAGWALSDGQGIHYPRTDPAVIVAVTDLDDRILLANNHRNSPDRYSLIAGFVDPGESLEAAAAREVHEEADARIHRIRYAGSQPWPFPASLMVGFTAELFDTHPDAVRPDGIEIRDVRWFTRAELREEVRHPQRRITLPEHPSIARALIEQWNGAPLKDTP